MESKSLKTFIYNRGFLRVRQIFCGFMTIFLLISASCAGKQEKVKKIGSKSVYRITLSDSFSKVSSKLWTLANIKALVKGRKVYNANLDGSVTGGSGNHRQGDSSTWEYNDIPVWSLLDYLRNERFGKGLPDDAFDSNWADWQTAADVCTANVVNVSGGSNIALLNCHAVIDTSRKVIDNVRELTKGCRAFLPYVCLLYTSPSPRDRG